MAGLELGQTNQNVTFTMDLLHRTVRGERALIEGFCFGVLMVQFVNTCHVGQYRRCLRGVFGLLRKAQFRPVERQQSLVLPHGS
ncbi:MAG TPA: hypothetical protein VJ723_09160, partial [Candidatus Angelobacter sp.]|nr:hypothetical protein [Candidatus Angelobacter sp.]